MMTMVSPEYIEKAAKRTDKIHVAIKTARKFGISEEELRDYLVSEFNITPGYAQNCLDADWEDEE